MTPYEKFCCTLATAGGGAMLAAAVSSITNDFNWTLFWGLIGAIAGAILTYKHLK